MCAPNAPIQASVRGSVTLSELPELDTVVEVFQEGLQKA